MKLNRISSSMIVRNIELRCSKKVVCSKTSSYVQKLKLYN